MINEPPLVPITLLQEIATRGQSCFLSTSAGFPLSCSRHHVTHKYFSMHLSKVKT